MDASVLCICDKKRTNVILKLLKNQERGSLMKSIITEEIVCSLI